jgi:SAM-dependent methyltransferase
MEKAYTSINGDYLKSNPNYHVEDSNWKAKQIKKLIHRNNLKIDSIAEVGCGAGAILNELQQKLNANIRFTGFDISQDAIDLAKRYSNDGLNFERKFASEIKDSYDLLLVIDVFEHVEDYIGFLDSIKAISNFKIFHIPLDISVQTILFNKLLEPRKSVRHLHYFTKDTALETLKDLNYEIIDYFYTPSSIELPGKKFTTLIANFFRKFLYSINKDFAVRLLGGYSLILLTRNN